MSLHRLTSVTIGVPNVAETAAYYQAFGLTEVAPGRLATTDGGEQLILVERARRELVALGVGVLPLPPVGAWRPAATATPTAGTSSRDAARTAPATSRTRRRCSAKRWSIRACSRLRSGPSR